MNFPVKHVPMDMPENAITERIIKCAIAVHRELGPGLLEEVYEEAMDVECKFDGLHVLRQFKVPVLYRGKAIGEYKPDMLINNMVIVEIKSVERFDPVFEAQVLTYLRITNKRVGLLINFNSRLVKDGIKRFILSQNNQVNGDKK
ncbi:MAG: GxxExxY protein [Anaerolineae bacterium]|nr:GxxExxY protein [Anaerolineae bacterium]MCI0609281.1 GxxExxY protein [Anaerolineae bacterium]